MAKQYYLLEVLVMLHSCAYTFEAKNGKVWWATPCYVSKRGRNLVSWWIGKSTTTFNRMVPQICRPRNPMNDNLDWRYSAKKEHHPLSLLASKHLYTTVQLFFELCMHIIGTDISLRHWWLYWLSCAQFYGGPSTRFLQFMELAFWSLTIHDIRPMQ